MEATLTNCSGNTNEDVIFCLAVYVNEACVSLVDSLKSVVWDYLLSVGTEPTILAQPESNLYGGLR